MKKAFIIIALSIVMISCNSPENQANSLMDVYFKENLKDPSSYECIKKGSLCLYTPMAMAIEQENIRVINGEASTDTINDFLEHIKSYFIKNNTNPYDTLAWKISIKYRAKNSYGGYDINDCVFYFDKGITKIIDIKNK